MKIEINCGIIEYKNGCTYKALFHCQKCLMPNDENILDSKNSELNLQCMACGEFNTMITRGEFLVYLKDDENE